MLSWPQAKADHLMLTFEMLGMDLEKFEKTKKGNTWRITEVNEIECKECDE